jgi:hypothetical protein
MQMENMVFFFAELALMEYMVVPVVVYMLVK